jgi:hypothetical protein
VELYIGVDPTTQSPMYREFDFFHGGGIEPVITVTYRQWLLTPSGVKFNEENQRRYLVMDLPAITTQAPPVLVTPAVYDTVDPTILLTPAVYTPGVITIVSPAQPHYTGWLTKLITTQMVGMQLGTDIIIGSINATLQGLPFDVIDGYIIRF